MNKHNIKQGIINKIKSSKTTDYSFWTIGLTHNPRKRKNEHKSFGESVEYWKHWVANSLPDAEEIESYFVNEKYITGLFVFGKNLNQSSPVYVYVY